MGTSEWTGPLGATEELSGRFIWANRAVRGFPQSESERRTSSLTETWRPTLAAGHANNVRDQPWLVAPSYRFKPSLNGVCHIKTLQLLITRNCKVFVPELYEHSFILGWASNLPRVWLRCFTKSAHLLLTDNSGMWRIIRYLCLWVYSGSQLQLQYTVSAGKWTKTALISTNLQL